jgi:two-component system sensor histidine kinase ResE
MSKERILVVDDEANIVDLVTLYLERDGFRVESASDGETALEMIRDDEPALVVLDIMLPEVDGFEVCRQTRASSEGPIIMLTARDDDIDKIVGLEIGADDYLTKPFNPRELVARVKAILRRMDRSEQRDDKPVLIGDVSIDPARREVQELAIAFNEMVTQVQTSQQIQKEFLANVSHELKTPLTSIQGFAQAMLDGTVEDSESRDHAAKVIYEETDRLGRLVEDLLDLARLDAGQIEFDRHPVDLSILLQSIIDRMSLSAAEKSVQLERHLDGLAPMIGDGDRLAQVFTNLLDNAIKHTPEGGTVRLHGETEAGWISIHVDDSGRGIPNEDLSHIFERFYQVDKARRGGKGRGVGLGLAISRQIVEAHGGRLVAQSAIGKGSRFTVQMPIVQPFDETLIHQPD